MVLTAAATGLATAGCISLPQQPSSPRSEPAVSPSSAPPAGASTSSTSGESAANGTASPSGPETAFGLGPVVASRRITVPTAGSDANGDSHDPSGRMTVQLYPLQRSGQVVSLNFTLSLAADADGDWDMSNQWGGTEISDTSISSVQLWDEAHGKVYHPGTDKDGECLCSYRAYLSPAGTEILTAAFAAPPAGMATMTVSMPMFGTIRDVPIQ